MKLNKPLIVIFVLALLLRIINLDSIPYGFHADEARVGWNAYSILKTAEDDRGNSLPLYYDTFGDYRPTGIFYATIPSLLLFGKSIFAVRFPSALIGALSIFAVYYFAKKLLKVTTIALYASAFLAVSPWHVSVSRATSEVVISIFFILISLYFYLNLFDKNSDKKINIILVALFLVISNLFYHSMRILAPFLYIALFLSKIKLKKYNLKDILTYKIPLGVITVSFLMMLFFASSQAGRGRFKQVSIFYDLDVAHDLSRLPFELGPNRVWQARILYNKPVTLGRRFIEEYMQYFDSSFLINPISARPDRYTIAETGLLSIVGFAIFIVGLGYAISKNEALPVLLLLAVSPLPAALTTEDTPNLHRAMFMLIPIILFQAYGLYYFITQKFINNSLYKLIIGLYLLNYLFIMQMYTIHTQYRIGASRNAGNLELATIINKQINNYDEIYFTNIPDTPYPWIAFFGQFDPKEFNPSAIGRSEGVWQYKNLIFTGQRCPSRDLFEPQNSDRKVLVVDAEGCASESNLNSREDVSILEQIKRPDEHDTVVYTLWSN